MKKLFALAIMGIVAGCGQQGASSGPDKFAYCNNKSDNLADYGLCRCRHITGAKTLTKEMDDCLTEPKLYAEGYKGEIPENIRNLMK